MTTTQLIIQALLFYGPDVARSIQKLFTTDNPTIEQWEELFTKADKSYRDIVTNTKLPPLVIPH